MSDVTRILNQIESGHPSAAEKLLPLVYDELRKLASAKLAQEKSGQTLQATALMHEAYLKLVDHGSSKRWDGRGHFFAAAAEAMRRILVDQARRKNSLKRSGHRSQQPNANSLLIEPEHSIDLLALDEALDRLTAADAPSAQLVKLRYFAGLTSRQASEVMGISPRTADRLWVYAKSFLFRELDKD